MANLTNGNRDVSQWLELLDFPAVNVSEDAEHYSIEVVAPGFDKEDFKLKVDDDILTVTAETKTETNEEKGNEYTRSEYSYNSFTRSFHLPDNVKEDSIIATYQDGVLKLQMPKSKKHVKANKEIPVK